MDKIELVVTHDAGGPVSRYWSAIFGMAGGTVGRAGQNKLVLHDDDAMVARVHAMVRLDSDQAYIANLCERRSVHVNGREVLSGQEVPLVPGTSVGIGPYQLRAVIPGQHSNLQATPAKVSCTHTEGISESASAVGTSAQPVTSTPGANAFASAIDLASLPNPWADIPVIEGEDPHLSGLLLSSQPKAPSQHMADSGAAEDNPFAMLGRVEASSAATLVPEQCPSERGPTSAMTVTHSASSLSVADKPHAEIPKKTSHLTRSIFLPLQTGPLRYRRQRIEQWSFPTTSIHSQRTPRNKPSSVTPGAGILLPRAWPKWPNSRTTSCSRPCPERGSSQATWTMPHILGYPNSWTQPSN